MSRLTDIGRLFALVALAGAGCGGSPSSPPPPPPPAEFKVDSTSPADNTSGQADDAPISVVFSAPVAPGTVTSESVKLSTADGSIPAALTVGEQGGKGLVSVKPQWRLAPGQAHTLLISTAVTSTSGGHLASPTQVRFTTTGPTWQLPKVAYASACRNAELLDDGTLVLGCIDSTVQVRSPTGVWQAPMLNWAGSLFKTQDQRLFATFRPPQLLAQAPDQILQLVDSGHWVEPRFSGYTDFFWQTLSRDSFMVVAKPAIGSRPSRDPVIGGQWLLAAMDHLSGIADPDPSLTVAPTGISSFSTRLGPACSTAAGDKVVIATVSFTRAVGNNWENEVWAHVYGRRFGGWLPPTKVGATQKPQLDRPAVVLNCSANAALLRYRTQLAEFCGVQVYSEGNWASGPPCSTTGTFVHGSTLAWAEQGGVATLALMNDFRIDAQGHSAVEGDGAGGILRRYAGVPRMHEAPAVGVQWAAIPGLPYSQPSVAYDADFGAFGTLPNKTLHIGTYLMAPIGQPLQTFMVSYDSQRGWSNPWSTPLLGFTPMRITFDSGGRGVAVGEFQGQTFVSEWK